MLQLVPHTCSIWYTCFDGCVIHDPGGSLIPVVSGTHGFDRCVINDTGGPHTFSIWYTGFYGWVRSATGVTPYLYRL